MAIFFLDDDNGSILYLVLVALFILELCISALQAYIFVSLLVLYANETV